MRFSFYTIILSFFITLPANARECDEQIPKSKLITSYSNLGEDFSADWTKIGLDYIYSQANCGSKIIARYEQEKRFGITQNTFGAGFNIPLDNNWNIATEIEASENAIFVPDYSFSINASKEIKIINQVFSGIVVNAEIANAKYSITNAIKYGLSAEFYPKHTEAWFKIGINRTNAYDKYLPLSYSVQMNIPVSQKIAINLGGGQYYETYDIGYQKVIEAAIGVKFITNSNFDYSLYLNQYHRDGLQNFHGFGLSLGWKI